MKENWRLSIIRNEQWNNVQHISAANDGSVSELIHKNGWTGSSLRNIFTIVTRGNHTYKIT